ncbi:MAG: FliI/YscN family ATPase [Phycisphaerales bacterium JB038]
MTALAAEIEALAAVQPLEIRGRVETVRGLTVLVSDLPLPVGATVRVRTAEGSASGEVIGFDRGRAIVMMHGAAAGIREGDVTVGDEPLQTVPVGADLVGRVVNGFLAPIDGGRPIRAGSRRPLLPAPLSPLKRRLIAEPLATGVRVIDTMATFGKGQRMGIFAGPGIGKSMLLASIARGTTADVNVIAMVGERGREVRDFVERTLGEEGLARSVVVVATSDESPLLRVRATFAACCVAEYFRQAGRDVLFMMDSVTRFAQAQRQIGLSVGEPPATKGYTPSVFANLPLLLERAGAVEGEGSITGVYTVLVEGDDLSEPISDAARGVLDGHLILSRKLADRGHFPAVDVLGSISRVADDVCAPQHNQARRLLIQLAAAYDEIADLVQIGAYARGSSVESDAAIDLRPSLNKFLQQHFREISSFQDSVRGLLQVAEEATTLLARGGGT